MKSSPKLEKDKWAVNASPVIALARVGQVGLLARLPKQIILPGAVAEEISIGPENDPARRAVESALFEII